MTIKTVLPAALAVLVTALNACAPLAPSTMTPPTGIPTIAVTATPQNAIATPPAGHWKLFSSREHGFEFRYPESCGVTELDRSFHVGERIELAILPSEGAGLADYVRRFLDDRAKNSNWQVESTGTGSLGGRDAITVDYRFGGQGRFGTATFALKDADIFIWGLTAGGFTCDEPDVYQTVLSSFRFTR